MGSLPLLSQFIDEVPGKCLAFRLYLSSHVRSERKFLIKGRILFGLANKYILPGGFVFPTFPFSDSSNSDFGAF
jgi:hypothetical protein